ncbi:hypothetical protein HS125_06240 [bacterium]|nr:hypothetical protein [bacterium]
MKGRCHKQPAGTDLPPTTIKRIESILRLEGGRMAREPEAVLAEVNRRCGLTLTLEELRNLNARVQPGGGLGVSIVERRADVPECT